jgi:hypothetical protein
VARREGAEVRCCIFLVANLRVRKTTSQVGSSASGSRSPPANGVRRLCLLPTAEDPLHLGPDVFACLGAVDASHEQLVVARVLVAHGGGDGERDRLRSEGATGRAPPHPTAAAGAGVAGDRLGALARAAGIEPRDLARHPFVELDVLGLSPRRLALPAPRPRLRVGQALSLDTPERLPLDEDPLPLVAAARATEANDDRRQPARLPRPAGQRRVAGRQEDEMVEVGAAHADRPRLLHQQEVPRPTAAGAGPFLERRDDHQLGRAALPLAQALPLAFGQLRRDPMSAVGTLDSDVAADAEAQTAAIARAGEVIGLAREQAASVREALEEPDRLRQLLHVHRHRPLEAVDPSLTPIVHPPRVQPAQTDEDVDCADMTPLGERGVRHSDDASLEIDRPAHVPADSPIPTRRRTLAGRAPSGRACKTAPVAKKRTKARVPGTKSAPVFPVPDPRAMEGTLAAIGRGAAHYAADEALFQAQDLMYEAFEAQGARGVTLAREALAISPDCADAYLLLAEETASSLEEARELLERGVAAGERALGPEPFEEDVGYFWGLIETRPYMRSRAALAETLWALGRREEAVEHQRELLRLNPNDNQGIRYRQAEYLVALERYEELDELFAAYEDDAAAAFAYTKALAAFRREGNSSESRALLAEARELNPHVPAYLSGRKRLPTRLPDYVGFGDASEAVDYAVGAKAQWEDVPGALAWLAA